jgi:hypothetical protein
MPPSSQPNLLTQLWGAKRLVEIESGADQGKVRKSLGEIPQRLAAGPDLLGIEPQVVRVAQHLLKDVPGAVHLPHTGECLDQPERAHTKRSLFSREAIG